jgi:hypothetical protein
LPNEIQKPKRLPEHSSLRDCPGDRRIQWSASFRKIILAITVIFSRETSRESEISGSLSQVRTDKSHFCKTESIAELCFGKTLIRRQMKIVHGFDKINVNTLTSAKTASIFDLCPNMIPIRCELTIMYGLDDIDINTFTTEKTHRINSF